MHSNTRFLTVLGLSVFLGAAALPAQRGTLTQEQIDRRWELERELHSLAIVERKVMMPMRDGVRLATDIYRPKDVSSKVPMVFVKTPYNFNYLGRPEPPAC